MKRQLLVLVTLALSLLTASADPLDIGAKVPDASAFATDGAPVRLRPLLGPQYTLVYFFPKADTPGCTIQAKGLRDATERLETYGIKVIGISNDKPADQLAFAKKYDLNFTLLADPQENVIRAFGVPLIAAHAGRQSFLVRGGRIVWRDLKVDPLHQAADAMRAVSALPPTPTSKAG